MASSLHQWFLFCPISLIYFSIQWVCSRLWLLLYSCLQWIRRLFRRSFGRQRQNSLTLTDIRSRDSVDMGEYDVLDHEELTTSDLEETVAFNTASNTSVSTSPGASMCMCTTNNKTLPIGIPKKIKHKKDFYDPHITSSMCSTFEAEDTYHHPTPANPLISTSEDDISSSSSSSPETSLIFPMSPLK